MTRPCWQQQQQQQQQSSQETRVACSEIDCAEHEDATANDAEDGEDGEGDGGRLDAVVSDSAVIALASMPLRWELQPDLTPCGARAGNRWAGLLLDQIRGLVASACCYRV